MGSLVFKNKLFSKFHPIIVPHPLSVQKMMAPQWLIGAIILAAAARNLREKLGKSKMQIVEV